MAPQDNNFQLSRKSRAGALLLLGILLLATVVWRLLPALFPPRLDPKEKELQLAWEKFEKEHVNDAPAPEKGAAYEYHDKYKSTEVAIHMAPFDPNTAGEEQLMALGLPQRTARTLIKYRSKGGQFRKKEDLQKLYTLSREDYERIAPYVCITGHAAPDKYIPSAYAPIEREQPVSVELNEADAEALIALRGIGPGYSRRIIAFRDALGGFLRVEQLQEVYGFPDSTYQQLKDKFRVDISKLKKIDVNTATEEELAKHPYIGRKLAGNIIKLRKDLKNYTDMEQLRQVPLINDEKYRKIAPYLSTY